MIMHMPKTDQSGERRAALALHALSAHDRQRVMAKLSPSFVNALQPLLDELDALGIPKGRPWVADDAIVPSPSSPHTADARKLWALAADQVLALLTDQSLDTVAVIVACTDWPWRDQVVKAWPIGSRTALHDRLERMASRSLALDHRVVQSLLADMAKHIDYLPPAAAKHKPSWLRSVLPNLQHLF